MVIMKERVIPVAPRKRLQCRSSKFVSNAFDFLPCFEFSDADRGRNRIVRGRGALFLSSRR